MGAAPCLFWVWIQQLASSYSYILHLWITKICIKILVKLINRRLDLGRAAQSSLWPGQCFSAGKMPLNVFWYGIDIYQSVTQSEALTFLHLDNTIHCETKGVRSRPVAHNQAPLHVCVKQHLDHSHTIHLIFLGLELWLPLQLWSIFRKERSAL